MMKNEFEAIVGACIIDEKEWDMVHTVYQFHPEIDDVNGKKQVAELWLNDQEDHYSAVLKYMFEVADKIRTLQGNITMAKISQNNIAYWEQEMKELQEA